MEEDWRIKIERTHQQVQQLNASTTAIPGTIGVAFVVCLVGALAILFFSGVV